MGPKGALVVIRHFIRNINVQRGQVSPARLPRKIYKNNPFVLDIDATSFTSSNLHRLYFTMADTVSVNAPNAHVGTNTPV